MHLDFVRPRAKMQALRRFLCVPMRHARTLEARQINLSRLSMCSDVRFWSRATLKTRLSKRVSCGATDPVQPGSFARQLHHARIGSSSSFAEA